MSTFAACGHKAEWICKECASCSVCCKHEPSIERFVHINTKEAAVALGRWAWSKRQEWEVEAENKRREGFDRGEPL